jgi:ABC-type polar amino acid transport system ATPase subunit
MVAQNIAVPFSSRTLFQHIKSTQNIFSGQAKTQKSSLHKSKKNKKNQLPAC